MRKSVANQWERQIKMKIKKRLPDIKFRFEQEADTLKVKLIDHNTSFNITRTDSVNGIVDYIDNIINNSDSVLKRCGICTASFRGFQTCSDCELPLCMECYCMVRIPTKNGRYPKYHEGVGGRSDSETDSESDSDSASWSEYSEEGYVIRNINVYRSFMGMF